MKNNIIFGHHCIIEFLGINTGLELFNSLHLSYESSVGDIELADSKNRKICNGYFRKHISIFQNYYPYLTTGYMFILGFDRVLFEVFILGLSFSFDIKFPWMKTKKRTRKGKIKNELY